MLSKDRQPPRFVPTLTEVVEPAIVHPQVDDDHVPLPAAPSEPSESSNSSESFMPLAQAQPGLAAIDLVNEQVSVLSQQAMDRIMARVDAVLEERLRYALADLVQLHTAALYQAMRSEVQEAVRTSVQEAVAQEQQAQPAS